MGLESPISVLYNADGTEIAVSQSQAVSGSLHPGILVAGSGSNGGAVFFRMAQDGALFVTGTLLTTAAVGTQSVKIDQWSSNVTASVKVDTWTTSVTASTREIGAETTNVSSANSSLTSYNLLAANPNRIYALFWKEGNGTCYVKFGTTASATSYTVQLTNGSSYETPRGYSGRVDIVFSSVAATSILRVTEILRP